MARFAPINEANRTARRHARALPRETHQSYPVPVRRQQGLRIAYVYSPNNVTPQGTTLWPPNYVAYVNAGSGRFEELVEMTPGEFGPARPPAEPMGIVVLPEGMSTEEFLAQEKRFYELFDFLLPLFESRVVRAGREGRQRAVEFGILFDRLAEEPLVPYYRALGKDFLAWLEQVKE